MYRRRALFVVVIIVALVGAGALVAEAKPSTNTTRYRPWGVGTPGPAAVPAGPGVTAAETLVLVEQGTDFEVVDTGAAGDTPGDYLVVRGDLFDKAGRRVGFHQVQCTLFFHDTIQCVGGFVLTGQGEIVGQALEGGNIQPDLIAVTGGTGRFRNARGQASVTFLPNGQVRFVFELLP